MFPVGVKELPVGWMGLETFGSSEDFLLLQVVLSLTN
jgi:hypothetical protein